MTGMVGVIAQETARFADFWVDLGAMTHPAGIGLHVQIEGSIAQARNAIVERFLATDAPWLVMIDDDHAIPSDFVCNIDLSAHPILASVYLTRKAPFTPTLYGPPTDSGFGLVTLPDLPLTGIVPIYAAGASGMFVRRDVYERMPRPWYELGQSDNLGEDLWFCHKAQRLGIPVAVDMDRRLGHLAPFAIWPDVHDGQWVTSLRRGDVGFAINAARLEA